MEIIVHLVVLWLLIAMIVQYINNVMMDFTVISSARLICISTKIFKSVSRTILIARILLLYVNQALVYPIQHNVEKPSNASTTVGRRESARTT